MDVTRVLVDGREVGWLDDNGVFYRGLSYDNRHPTATFRDERLIANDIVQTNLGRFKPGGVAYEPRYPHAELGRVLKNGEIRDAGGALVATGDGPDLVRAGAAFLLLVHAGLLRTSGDAPSASWLPAIAGAAHAAAEPEYPATQTAVPEIQSIEWRRGDPYPPSQIPDPGGPGPRGLFGRGPKRAGAFRVGERVTVMVPELATGVPKLLGPATILDISDVPERGFGTKLYPSFLVEFDADGSRGWFNGISFTKIGS